MQQKSKLSGVIISPFSVIKRCVKKCLMWFEWMLLGDSYEDAYGVRPVTKEAYEAMKEKLNGTN